MDIFLLFSIYIPLALGLCALAGALTGRLSARRFYAVLTIATLIRGIANIAHGKALYAATDSGLAAYYAWRWWNNGGDDTKRRLRNLAKHFTPTRRTAPVTG
ncbi:hypothetical protein [Streptomyces xanthochromogenes]|uniref:hypothetical protein n=1 Tax=Streptomyces xanthochromogenes TaxID=67384 RepID=UPI003414B1FF